MQTNNQQNSLTLWLELFEPAVKQLSWKPAKKYPRVKSVNLNIVTNDRFIAYSSSFGMQILSGRDDLEQLPISAKAGLKSLRLTFGRCSTLRITYQALGQ